MPPPPEPVVVAPPPTSGVSLGINIGSALALVIVPRTHVYYAPSVPYNYFAFGGQFYLFHNEVWLSSRSYNVAWTKISTYFWTSFRGHLRRLLPWSGFGPISGGRSLASRWPTYLGLRPARHLPRAAGPGDRGTQHGPTLRPPRGVEEPAAPPRGPAAPFSLTQQLGWM